MLLLEPNAIPGTKAIQNVSRRLASMLRKGYRNPLFRSAPWVRRSPASIRDNLGQKKIVIAYGHAGDFAFRWASGC